MTFPESTSPTYYDILQIPSTADELTIKKAYRRLALQFHPDRQLAADEVGQREATAKFQKIGEAYEVLSDPVKKREYDIWCQNPKEDGYGFQNQRDPSTSFGNRTYQYHPARDAFSQFNDLFHNDAFFREAFRDMDDIFAQRFQASSTADDRENEAYRQAHSQERGGCETATRQNSSRSTTTQGWFPWLLNLCGIELQISTYSRSAEGNVTASSYKSHRTGNTTQKLCRTYTNAQGKHVTIQSMEKNGNRIEDVYVDRVLVERRVNGVVEGFERIS